MFLKFSWFLGCFVLNLFLFFPDFLKIFHNREMIYNTKNESNDITESHKEKETCFNVHFQYSQLKIMGLYKIGSLTSPH